MVRCGVFPKYHRRYCYLYKLGHTRYRGLLGLPEGMPYALQTSPKCVLRADGHESMTHPTLESNVVP